MTNRSRQFSLTLSVEGYPDIQLDIEMPVTRLYKIRKEGITFDVSPTKDPDLFHLVARKGRLLIADLTLKDQQGE